MIISDLYKEKPTIYYTQKLEEFASKRDNILYTEKDINISFVEYKLGVLIVFEKRAEKRYIESGMIPVTEFEQENKINREKQNIVVIDPWEYEIDDELLDDIDENNKEYTNRYIITEENKYCESCNGTGKQACNHCGGSGKLGAEEESFTCYECEGNGFFICDVCNGTGKLKYINTLVRDLEKEHIEKSFIIDELGSVQVVHKRINTDYDYLTSLTHEEVMHGELRKTFDNIGVSKEVSENLLLSIIPFLDKKEEDIRTVVDKIKIYTFPMSIVYSKIGGNKNDIFIFAGKDFSLIEKSELVKHSTDMEKEFLLLTANISGDIKDKVHTKKNENKKDINILIITGIVSFTVSLIIFTVIFFLFIFPSLQNNNKNNTSNMIKMEQYTPPAPGDCSIIKTKEKLDTTTELAELYVQNESYTQAVSIYKIISDCYNKSDMRKENIHFFKRIAELYQQLKNSEQAKNYYSKAFVLAREYNLTPEQALFSSLIAQIEYKNDNYTQAGKQYKISSELYKRLGDTEQEITQLFKASQCYVKTERTDEAYIILERVLSYAEENDNKDLIGKTLINLADISLQRGLDTETVESYLQEAQKIVTEPYDTAKLNLMLGRYYYQRNKKGDKNMLQKALTHYQKAGNIFVEIEDYDMIATTLNSLGIILIELERFDESEEKLLKALDIRQMIGSKPDIASIKFNLAILREKQGQIAEAVQLMEDVVKIDIEFDLDHLGNDKNYLERLKRHLKGISDIKRNATEDIIDYNNTNKNEDNTENNSNENKSNTNTEKTSTVRDIREFNNNIKKRINEDEIRKLENQKDIIEKSDRTDVRSSVVIDSKKLSETEKIERNRIINPNNE